MGNTVTGPPAGAAPAHADRPWPPPARLVRAGLGVAALIGAVGVAAAGCLAEGGPASSTPTSASSITVTPAPPSAPESAPDTAGKTP